MSRTESVSRRAAACGHAGAGHHFGGGTGSHCSTAGSGLFTEVQAGSYVFMDEATTGSISRARGNRFGPALRVAVTVVGHSSAGFAITDGGSKSFALDGPPPRVFGGPLVGRIEWCGDEFGRVLPEPGSRHCRSAPLWNARPRIATRPSTCTMCCMSYRATADRAVAGRGAGARRLIEGLVTSWQSAITRLYRSPVNRPRQPYHCPALAKASARRS